MGKLYADSAPGDCTQVSCLRQLPWRTPVTLLQPHAEDDMVCRPRLTVGIGRRSAGWSKGLHSTGDKLAPKWIATAAKSLWRNNDPSQQKAVSFKGWHDDLYAEGPHSRKTPDPTDLPYSGMIYWQGTLHSLDNKTADRAHLLLGLVGPSSGAEYVQKEYITLLGSPAALRLG